MGPLQSTDDPALFEAPIRQQIETFVDEHRAMLASCLDGVTEAEARAELVPSTTTLLGLVKHATFVEGVWFGQAVTGRTRADLGLAADPEESFGLAEDDTIASVLVAHRAACDRSRAAAAALSLDDSVSGNRRGPLPLRWIYLHVLRELAQHCGHADILREQVVARR